MQTAKKICREAKRLLQLCISDGALDHDRVREVVGELARDRSRSRLATLHRLQRLVKLHVAQRAASVESAAPLPPEVRARVLAALSSRYGSGLSTVFAERPSLIGGLRIRVGSRVFDGSVQGRLAELQKRF